MRVLLISIIFLSGCSSVGIKQNFDQNLNGRWAWSTVENPCTIQWHKIEVQDAQKTIVFENYKPFVQRTGENTEFYSYNILGSVFNGYHIALESENRTDVDGEKITWFLIQKDENTYVWRRSDWAISGMTKPIYRCNH